MAQTSVALHRGDGRPVQRNLPIFILSFVLLPSLSYGQDAVDLAHLATRTASVEILQAPLKIDGHLHENAWQHATKQKDFTERKPGLGQLPPDRTEFALLADGDALYIGVWLTDSQPNDVRARTTARDSYDIFDDDAISIKLDPQLDFRTTAGFVLNPAGAKMDYRSVSEGSPIREFDAIWQGAAQQTATGWTAEFRIPWSALGVDVRHPPAQMGCNLSRDHSRRNATYDWALMPPPYSPFSASLYGRLTGIEQIADLPHEVTQVDQNSGDLQIVPYLLTGVVHEGYYGENAPNNSLLNVDLQHRFGFDVTGRLSQRWRGQWTFNTDFSQVELDDQIINLSRFSLYIPEKRDFFLKDTELFAFGRKGSAQLFHSRRLVEITTGIKAVGQPLENVRVAVLDVLGHSNQLTLQNAALVRAVVELGGGSNVGAMVTHSEAIGTAAGNLAVGVDGALRSQKTPLLIEGFALGTLGGSTQRDFFPIGPFAKGAPRDAGAAVDATWRGALWRPGVSYAYFGPDLRPDMGFFQRVGIQDASAKLNVEPRIGRYGLEKLTCGVTGRAILRAKTLELMDRVGSVACNLVWDEGYSLYAQGDLSAENVGDTFGVTSHTVIAAGDYQMRSALFSFSTPSVRNYSFGVDFGGRDYYGGTMLQLSPGVAIRLAKRFKLDAVADWRHVTFGAANTATPADFDSIIVNTRATIGFSPSVNLDVFGGWNRIAGTVPLQARLRWTWRQASDLFIAFTQQHHVPTDTPVAVGDTYSLLLKLTYAWL